MSSEKKAKAKKIDASPGGESAAPSAARDAEKAASPAADVAAYLKSLRQATLHRESSGRGGRTVTVVSCSPAPPGSLRGEAARVMRKGLGCGSHVEGEKIVLQGDIQARAEAWLAKQGVRKVVRGN